MDREKLDSVLCSKGIKMSNICTFTSQKYQIHVLEDQEIAFKKIVTNHVGFSPTKNHRIIEWFAL